MLLVFIKELLKLAPDLLHTILAAIDALANHGWTEDSINELKAAIPNDKHLEVNAEIDEEVEKAFSTPPAASVTASGEFVGPGLGEGVVTVPESIQKYSEETPDNG